MTESPRKVDARPPREAPFPGDRAHGKDDRKPVLGKESPPIMIKLKNMIKLNNTVKNQIERITMRLMEGNQISPEVTKESTTPAQDPIDRNTDPKIETVNNEEITTEHSEPPTPAQL